MLAVVLMYHEDFCKDFGFHNRLVHRVIDSAATLNVSNLVLVEWGKLIKTDWELRNAVNFKRSDTPYEARVQIQVDMLVKENSQVKGELKEVLSELKAVKSEVTAVKDLLYEMTMLLKPGSGERRRTPSPKRKKVSPGGGPVEMEGMRASSAGKLQKSFNFHSICNQKIHTKATMASNQSD